KNPSEVEKFYFKRNPFLGLPSFRLIVIILIVAKLTVLKGAYIMREAILILVGIMNDLHDLINFVVNDILHWNMTDKDLHFWVMGAIGFSVFFCENNLH